MPTTAGEPTEQSQASELIEAAAAGLSRTERQVLLLSARDGLPMREIAARLGISERRTERLLARAVAKFDAGLSPPRPSLLSRIRKRVGHVLRRLFGR